jgi:hypothetical protein
MVHRLAATLALVCLFCLCALAVSADSSLYGPSSVPGPTTNATTSYLGATGLMITPTAMVAAPLKASAYYHTIRTDPDQSFYGVTLGLVPGLEASGVRLENLEPLPNAPTVHPSATVFNAKYVLPVASWLKEPQAPKVAVGVNDASNAVNRTLYVVLSKGFFTSPGATTSFNLHLGYGHANKGDAPLDGLFAGFDYAPFSQALLQVEYDAKSFNADVRLYPAPWLSVDAGVVDNDLSLGLTLRSDW